MSTTQVEGLVTTEMESKTPLDIALLWAARGCPAFPIAISTKGDGANGTSKRPLTQNGHLDATTDRDTLREMFTNVRVPSGSDLAVGIVPGGGGLVAIDIDVHGEKNGFPRAEELGLRRSAGSRTPSGGEHRLFRLPDGVELSNTSPWAKDGIDIRAHHGWIVAPGCVTHFGAWTSLPVEEFETLPEPALARLLTINRSRRSDSGSNGSTASYRRLTDEDRELLDPLTATALSRMEREHGAHHPILRGDHDRWWVQVHRPGKRAGDGLGATIGYTAPGAVKIFSTSWQGLEADSIYEMGSEPENERTLTTRERVASWFIIAEDLADLTPPEPLIDDILMRDSLAMLAAPSGTYKSFLALDWACSVAAGIDWHDHGTASGHVVYAAGEGHRGYGLRHAAWCEAADTATQRRLHLVREAVQLGDTAQMQAFIEEITEIQPVLVVFDTLARSTVGLDENSATDMGLAIGALDRVRRAIDATVIVVHHHGKNPGSGARGSSALKAAMDTCITIDSSGHGRIKVICDKQKDAEPFAPINLATHHVLDSLVLCATEPPASKQWHPGTAVKASELDRLGVPLDAGRDQVRAMGVQGANALISDAQRYRRNAQHLSEDRSA